ncbi:hypothetical protein D1007_38345 [Hordeum vulgare]|nr:hypothetical protein D1007_38345 [Hordeum vulgare]
MRTPSIIDINDTPALDDVDEREYTMHDEEEFGSEDDDGDQPQIIESSAKGRRPKKQKSATKEKVPNDGDIEYGFLPKDILHVYGDHDKLALVTYTNVALVTYLDALC